MARPDFFNDNINREFPFQEGTVGGTGTVKNIANLIDAAIADCGFIMGPESEFDEATDSVYLETIERSTTDVFKFRFKATTTVLADSPIDFYRTLGDADYTTSFVESDALLTCLQAVPATPILALALTRQAENARAFLVWLSSNWFTSRYCRHLAAGTSHYKVRRPWLSRKSSYSKFKPISSCVGQFSKRR